MTLDLMSSEESNVENDTDNDSEECFTIRKITWHSENVEDFFKNKVDPTAAVLVRSQRRCDLNGVKVTPH